MRQIGNNYDYFNAISEATEAYGFLYYFYCVSQLNIISTTQCNALYVGMVVINMTLWSDCLDSNSGLIHYGLCKLSVLTWRIPGTGEPGGLPSMGSHRVRHD